MLVNLPMLLLQGRGHEGSFKALDAWCHGLPNYLDLYSPIPKDVPSEASLGRIKVDSRGTQAG